MTAQLEHGVAADHDPVEAGVFRRQALCDVGRLGAGEQQHEVSRRQISAPLGRSRGGDGILIRLRRECERIDPRLTQQHETGGGGGSQADAHVHHRILEG